MYIFFLQVDETVKESLQIVLENVDHNWNLVYEDGDMKVQMFSVTVLSGFIVKPSKAYTGTCRSGEGQSLVIPF